MVTVRIKQRPDEDLEVSAHEARVLKGQGLLVEDEQPEPAPAKTEKGA